MLNKPKSIIPYVLVLILWIFLLGAACTYQRGPMLLATQKASPSTVAPGEATTTGEPFQTTLSTSLPLATAIGNKPLFPSTPEALVQAFILAQQDDPKLSEDYLSNTLKSKWANKKLADLMAIDGTIEGSAILSGAVAFQPPAAKVVVGLLVKGKNYSRQFNLIKENDHWAIDSVESVQ